MKGIKTIGGILMVFVFAVGIATAREQKRHEEFQKFFNFTPSGTNYLLWTGNPDSTLQFREQILIKQKWEKDYEYFWQIRQKMASAEPKEYEELRENFLGWREYFRDMRYLAYHFGYTPFLDDPNGLLKEGE